MEQLQNPRAFGNTPEVEEPGEMPATAAEQAQYDLVASRALKYIHGKGRDQILQSMGAANSPAEGIGQVTAHLFRQIKDSAKQGGQEIDDEIMLNAAGEVVEDLAELGQKEGIFKFDDQAEAQEQTEDSLLWAMQYYGKEAQGRGELDADLARKFMDDGMANENPTAPVTRGVREELHKPPPAGGVIGPMMKGAK